MADDSFLGGNAGGFFNFLDSPWAGAGAATLGAGADIWSLIQNMVARNQQQNVYKGLSDPSKLMAGFPGLSSTANQAVQRDLGANWATMTGGAPGGAMNQFVADALAKIEMDSLLKYLGIRSNTLQAAGQNIQPQQPMNALGGILKSLQVLRGIGGGGSPGLVSGFPTPGGTGFSGGSEAFRGDYSPAQQTPFPPPVTFEGGT